MNIGTKTTYWKFIQTHGITIPVIQRDYAQGREGKEVLRRRLLENIKSCLDTDDTDTGQELVLDFVYGMKDEDGHINPLDGQQRLTTLWLLHWYLLLKTKEVKKAIYDIESILNILSKFTYETRLSSRNFCECLCKKDNLEKLISSKNIRKDIENQTWFMAEWKQDPTVKAMLNMLGGEVPENEKPASIEEIFNENHKDYWNKLVEKNGEICPIKFYYLPLDGEIAQRPDDIYIKMNARGEHLTDFENFKADLIKFVRGKKHIIKYLFDKHRSNVNWKKDFENPELYLSECIDSTWTDVFWSQLVNLSLPKGIEDEKVPSVDKQLFAFLNRYFLNCIFAKTDLSYKKLNEKDTNKIEKENKNIIKFYQYIYGDGGVADVDIKYTDFALYKKAGLITLENFNALISIFNILKDNEKANIVKEFAKPNWAEQSIQEFVFFPHMKGDEIEPITQPQRVVFFGICRYLENCSKRGFEKNSFSEWMRFVWNMARNSDVDTVDNMIKVIKNINKLKEFTHSIKEGIGSKKTSKESSYFERQWNEEFIKLNIDRKKWDLILDAERLFHGNISFLLDDLLNKDAIEKAKNLIYEVYKNEETNEYNGLKKEKIAYKENWFIEVLPYFKTDLFTTNIYYKLTFHEKNGDVVKNINHDDNIIEAVKAYLRDDSKKEKENTEEWIYPLVNIIDVDKNLFDYSDSKLIRCRDNGIFLYKKTQWKKEQCILLWTTDEKTQNYLKNRNKFILEKLRTREYSLLTDRDEKIIKDFSDDNYGRPIILTDNQNTYYCGVNGYWENDKKEIVSYENN